MRWPARRLTQLAILLMAGVLYMLRPWKTLRLGRLRAERIGHLAVNTDLFLRRRQLGDPRVGAPTLFVAGRPCNRQLLEMFKRRLPVVESPLLARLLEVGESVLKNTPFFEPLPWQTELYRGFSEARASLAFTPEEEERGWKELASMGLGRGDWFVCFHARDAGYLDKTQPGRSWSYHDYRDCRVEDFLPAAEWLAARGGFAIRMGQHALAPLRSAHPRIRDYATHGRSDFLDIFLIAKCRFMIASDAGLFQVATILDVPTVNTNVALIDWASFRPDDIFIQKKLADAKTGRLIPYREVLQRGWERFYHSDWLNERGLRLIDNTPEEILAATREMHERLSGTLRYGAEDDELQRRYRALFTPRHRCHGFRSRLGRDFLAANKELILDSARALS